MIFNTPWFLVFFMAFYALLWVVPRGWRFYFVLAASALFHGHFAGPAGVAPIIVMAVAVYFIAFRLDQAQGAARRRWLTGGLAVPVLGLLWYKYRVFAFSSLASLVVAPSWAAVLTRASPMPLAISFFTFEFVHYLTDIYRGGKPIRHFGRFALFCIYFPSIVSGPIKRYEDFQEQLLEGIPHPSEAPQGLEGAAQLLMGFFKKLVIADNITTLIHLMEDKGPWGSKQVAILAVLLSIRILFDFSGYTDMALGLSKMVGLRLPVNFHFPYLALNPSDFWRRWHMSLSSWIRDYVYIPLGGSRQGVPRRVFNGVAAMALCGLWHGAAWNFMVWGVYHGVGLAVWNAWHARFPAPAQRAWWSRGISWAACMAFVAYGWIWFFYPLSRAWSLTLALFGHGGWNT